MWAGRSVSLRRGAALTGQAVMHMSDLTGRAAEEPGTEEGERDAGASSGILRVVGRQLKRFRVRAGLERPEFGSMTGYSASTIAAYEQGRRVPPPKFVDQADELLDAGGVLQEMKEEVARAQYPAFFRDTARWEAEAVERHVYANQAVPGLLQTEEYARAVFGMRRPPLDEDAIARRVRAAEADRRPGGVAWPVGTHSAGWAEADGRDPGHASGERGECWNVRSLHLDRDGRRAQDRLCRGSERQPCTH